MKILIYGLTQARGLPLAHILRAYGRHSVVGYGPDAPTPGKEHPCPEIVKLEREGTPIPLAPTLAAAVREGNDLAIVATSRAQSALENLHATWLVQNSTGKLLPTVVVQPHWEWRRPFAAGLPGLAVGHAPFDFNPHYVVDRLLTLKRIDITRAPTTPPGLVRMAVSDAWRWVDNHIPIWEHPPSTERSA